MPAKKKSTAKKAATKKKPVAKKKTVTKKKSAAKKKSAPKKKAVAKKKAVTKKKPAAKKKATAKKKAVAKKSPSKSTTAAKKKTVAKRASVQEVGQFVPYKLKKGEEYMNDAQLGHFRDILEAWKHDLMKEVDRTVHHMQDEAANFPDPNDRATQESEFTMELRTRDRERKLIKKIDESLAALDSGEYGFCEQCGVEIGIRRLEARPTATLCIDCKSLDEIRERQNG